MNRIEQIEAHLMKCLELLDQNVEDEPDASLEWAVDVRNILQTSATNLHHFNKYLRALQIATGEQHG